ncbi:uncharacterized protein LOC144129950 [Amblyomma americanum]
MAAMEPEVAADEPQEEPRFRFLARLAAVPLVADVVDQAYRCYGGAKARSPLLARALSTVENAATAVMRRCEPVARTSLGQPLEYVDRISCQCLEKLQVLFPRAFRPPEEIAADVAAFCHVKAAQLQRDARTKGGARDTFWTAAAGVFEGLEARLRGARVSGHLRAMQVDNFLDLEPQHDIDISPDVSGSERDTPQMTNGYQELLDDIFEELNGCP